jgi:hypothetical protein
MVITQMLPKPVLEKLWQGPSGPHTRRHEAPGAELTQNKDNKTKSFHG